MKLQSIRRTALLGGAALVLTGSAVGLAHVANETAPSAQAQAAPLTPPSTPGRGAFLGALARQLNVSTDRLQQAVTAAQAEAGPGAGFPGGRGEQRGPNLEAAAQAIGISVETLRAELPGKSLAQVAQGHGKNPADVATALKNTAYQRIDAAVANGRMTAEQAAQAKIRVAQRIDEMMNRVVPVGGPGSGTPGPGFQGPGNGTPRPGAQGPWNGTPGPFHGQPGGGSSGPRGAAR